MEAAPPRVWGAWASLGWTFLVIFVFELSWLLFGLFYLALVRAGQPDLKPRALLDQLDSGFFSALASCATTPFLIGLMFLLVRLRKHPVRGYLALQPVRQEVVRRWIVLFTLLLFAFDGFRYVTGHSIVSRSNLRDFETAGFAPLLWIAAIVCAPLFEEILFRGFLFRGLELSRAGSGGAIVVGSLLWSLLHLGYGWFEVTLIFITGLLLGVARLWTGSVVMAILLHAWGNMIATLELAWVAYR
jgi:uncharacterized protein